MGLDSLKMFFFSGHENNIYEYKEQIKFVSLATEDKLFKLRPQADVLWSYVLKID